MKKFYNKLTVFIKLQLHYHQLNALEETLSQLTFFITICIIVIFMTCLLVYPQLHQIFQLVLEIICYKKSLSRPLSDVLLDFSDNMLHLWTLKNRKIHLLLLILNFLYLFWSISNVYTWLICNNKRDRQIFVFWLFIFVRHSTIVNSFVIYVIKQWKLW